MYGIVVHVAFYLDCAIRDPWFSDSGPKAGSLMPYSKNGLNLHLP